MTDTRALSRDQIAFRMTEAGERLVTLLGYDQRSRTQDDELSTLRAEYHDLERRGILLDTVASGSHQVERRPDPSGTTPASTCTPAGSSTAALHRTHSSVVLATTGWLA